MVEEEKEEDEANSYANCVKSEYSSGSKSLMMSGGGGRWTGRVWGSRGK